MVQFQEKFTGAKARLFAEICLQYSQYAEDALQDTPDRVPLFSWLSPFQRVKLVRDLAVGLLVPNAPLPPPTIQHYAAFRALCQFLKMLL